MLRRVGTATLVVLTVMLGYSGVASAAPTGAAAVASGSAHSCAIRADDATIACWGATSGDVPVGRFTGVAAAGRQTCAIRESDGGVDCWGQSFWGLTPPSGVFKSIAGGGEQFCGVRADDTLHCWGGDPWSGLADVPAGAFRSAAVGESHACAVRGDRTVACWGYDDYGMSTPPAGEFAAVAAGTSHSCGVRAGDGSVACWGAEWMLGAPAGAHDAVSAGAQFSCALRAADGEPACWGADIGAPKKAPAVALRSIVTGVRHTCGIRRADRGVTCWGEAALDIPADLAAGDPDTDGDGHIDREDAFPNDAAEWADGGRPRPPARRRARPAPERDPQRVDREGRAPALLLRGLGRRGRVPGAGHARRPARRAHGQEDRRHGGAARRDRAHPAVHGLRRRRRHRPQAARAQAVAARHRWPGARGRARCRCGQPHRGCRAAPLARSLQAGSVAP